MRVIEVGQGDPWQPLTDLPFDLCQRLFLGGRDQHKSITLFLGPGRTSDPVNVIIRHARPAPIFGKPTSFTDSLSAHLARRRSAFRK